MGFFREKMQNGLVSRLAAAGMPAHIASVVSWANYPEADPIIQPAVNKRQARKLTNEFLQYPHDTRPNKSEKLLHLLYGDNYEMALAAAEDIATTTEFIGQVRRGEVQPDTGQADSGSPPRRRTD